MTAGRRDQLVIIERFTTTTNEYGEEIPAWATHGSEWVAVFYGRGDERRQAAMEQGNQAATFQMLSNSLTEDLLLKDRITHNRSYWDIVGISPDTPRRGLIEVTATRSGDVEEA